MIDINEVIEQASEKEASDIHLVYGTPIRIRVDGQLHNLN